MEGGEGTLPVVFVNQFCLEMPDIGIRVDNVSVVKKSCDVLYLEDAQLNYITVPHKMRYLCQYRRNTEPARQKLLPFRKSCVVLSNNNGYYIV